MENGKYNNGHPINTDILAEDEWRQCAKEWSEGDENLEQLIYFCLQNGIKTIASCSGHNGEKKPNIVFENNEKNKHIIDYIARNLKSIEGADIFFVAGNKGNDGEDIHPFTSFFLPTNDTSGFCKIMEICKGALDGKEYETDENLVIFRELMEKMKFIKFGSYIHYGFGRPMENESKFFVKNPIKNKVGEHIFFFTKDNMFNNFLKKSHLITNSGNGTTYYVEQTEENKEQIGRRFNKMLEKLRGKGYEITDSDLEQIATRPKEISVTSIFQKLKERVKTFFLGKDETKEKEIGE